MDLMACSREIKNQYRGLTLDEALDWHGEELPEEEAPAPSPIGKDQARQMLESIIGEAEAEEGENEENGGEEEGEDEEFSRLLSEGIEHFNNSREEEAIPIFESLIRERDTPELHKWLGMSHYDLAEGKEEEDEKKALEKAALHLEEAAERMRDSDTYNRAGICLFRLGRKTPWSSELYEKAINYLEIFTAEPNRRHQGIFWLAAALSNLASYKLGSESKTLLERSIRLFKEHIKRDSSPNIKNWLGSGLYKLAQCHSGEKRVQIMEEAMPFLRESCDERGESIDYHWRGSAAMYFGRQKEDEERAELFEEGVNSLRKAVKGDDDTTNLQALKESLTELAGIKEGEEKIILLEESLSCLEKIPGLGSLLSSDSLKSDIEKEKRKFAEAKGEILECLPMVAICHGYEHFKESNHDMAAKYFTQAIREGHIDDYVDLLSSLFERIDKDFKERDKNYGYEQAVLCISNIAMENVLENKGNPSHYLAFGAALAHIGLERIPEDKRGTFILEKARDNLAKSWSINKGENPEDLRWLGKAFVGLGDRKEGKDQVEMYEIAVECGKKAVEIRGGDKDKKLYTEDETKLAAAKAGVEPTIEDFFGEPDPPKKPPEERLAEISVDALVWQGRKLLELADYRRAIPVFEELANARGSPEDLTTLGYCYREQVARLEGNKEEELRHLRKSVETFEKVPAAEMNGRDHLEMGLAFVMLADRVEGDEKLSASERLIPHLEEAIKGNAFDTYGPCDAETAHHMLASALEDVGDARTDLGEKEGLYKRAVEHYEKAKTPDHTPEGLAAVRAKLEGMTQERWSDFFGEPEEENEVPEVAAMRIFEEDEETGTPAAPPRPARPVPKPRPASPPRPPIPGPLRVAKPPSPPQETRLSFMKGAWDEYTANPARKSDSAAYEAGKSSPLHEKEDIELFVRKEAQAAVSSPSYFASYVAGLIDKAAPETEEREGLYTASEKALENAVVAAPNKDEGSRITLALLYLEMRRDPKPEHEAKKSKTAAKKRGGRRRSAQTRIDLDETEAKKLEGSNVGNYTIEELIASADLCNVYKAMDNAGRQCAVKVLKKRWRKHASDRFIEEAEKLKLLNNMNTARYLDAGTDEKEGPYLAMELFEGSWSTLASMERPFPLVMAIDIARQVASSLVYAHKKGVVHGCLKPSEVFYDKKTGNVKVADFGLTNNLLYMAYSDESMEDCGRGMIDLPKGIIEYLPEESWLGEGNPEPKSDVSTLGLLFYNLLTGKTKLSTPIYRKETNEKILAAVKAEHASAPDELTDLLGKMINADISARLAPSTVVKKLTRLADRIKDGLTKDFKTKYESAKKLIEKPRTRYGVTAPEEVDAILAAQKALSKYAEQTDITSYLSDYLKKIDKAIESRKEADFKEMNSTFMEYDDGKKLGYGSINSALYHMRIIKKLSNADDVRDMINVYREVGSKWGFFEKPSGE